MRTTCSGPKASKTYIDQIFELEKVNGLALLHCPLRRTRETTCTEKQTALLKARLPLSLAYMRSPVERLGVQLDLGQPLRDALEGDLALPLRDGAADVRRETVRAARCDADARAGRGGVEELGEERGEGGTAGVGSPGDKEGRGRAVIVTGEIATSR